jgi:hypothetical protein
MVTLNEAFPSKYLKAADLPEPVVATIKLVTQEKIKGFDGEMQDKVIVSFARGLKPLILNRSNFEAIGDIAGSFETEDWTGTKIEIYATPVSFKGKTTNGVRVREPGAEQKKPAKAKPKMSADASDTKPELNDELPPFAWGHTMLTSL